MDYSTPFQEEINYILGGVVTLLSFLFGSYWWLFAIFLLGNILDYFTGWAKCRINQTESSSKGLKGVLKKFGYWIMIAMSFGLSRFFISVGNMLHINLEITVLLGWFVLATLMVNEARSILENLVECDVKVPDILIRSLDVVNKTLHTMDGSLDIDVTGNEEKDIYRINLDIPLDELEGKEEIRLKINKQDGELS